MINFTSYFLANYHQLYNINDTLLNTCILFLFTIYIIHNILLILAYFSSISFISWKFTNKLFLILVGYDANKKILINKIFEIILINGNDEEKK